MMEFKGRQHSGPPRIPNWYGQVDSLGRIRADDKNHSDFWMEITLTAEEIARLRPRDEQDSDGSVL